MIVAAAVSRAYLDAVIAGDRRRAFGIVDDARGAGMNIGTLYLEVLQPAMREIGALWQRNQITVAVEHLATGITEAAMARMYQEIFAAVNDDGPTLLAAAAETERHVVGLRMVCDLLELQGWQTVLLGACVPIDSLVSMARDLRPDVVALSATILPNVPQLRSAIAALRQADLQPPPVIAVGGRLFLDNPALAARIGADFTAADAAELVQQLEARFPGR